MSTRKRNAAKTRATPPLSHSPARNSLAQRRPENPAATAAPSVSEVPPIVDDVLRSPGQPLDPTTRAFNEPRLGQDFSQVRVHTNEQAAESARAMDALAYTVGQDVAFGPGQYAPNTADGATLLAHELTHVAQQAPGGGPESPSAKAISDSSDTAEVEADLATRQVISGQRVAVTQRQGATVQTLSEGAAIGLGIGAGVLGATGLGLGIAALAGAFDKTTFSDDELKAYLKELEKGRREGSDNKARAVVQRWQDGEAAFSVLTVPIRVLLIQEMASGYLSEDDQKGILALLKESIPSELLYILPKIGIETLKTRFDGENRKQIDALIENQEIEAISFGGDWTVEGVKKIIVRHGDQSVLKSVNDLGYKIIRFEQAFEKWQYADGRIADEEISGLQGNHSKPEKKIRLFRGMTNEVTASVLFHEIDHALSGVEGGEGEIHARIEAEKFGIRHGLPEAEPGYRKADGTIDEAKIRGEITVSPHYRPDPAVRQRVPGGRRYVGEVETVGWEIT
jgi:Domain of unknown function (DUF4157)